MVFVLLGFLGFRFFFLISFVSCVGDLCFRRFSLIAFDVSLIGLSFAFIYRALAVIGLSFIGRL